MTSLNKIQKSIADRFMRMTIQNYVKELAQKGVVLTTERVMQDIDGKSLDILIRHGYTKEGITRMVDKAIRRQKK